MTTVRCPSCRRALNLPDTTLADTAQCPVCESVFPVADLEVQHQRPPRPSTPAVPIGAREIPTHRSDDRDLAPNAPRLDGAAHRGLALAGGWLKAMVVFGMFQVVTCGLCGCLGGPRRGLLGLRPGTVYQLTAALLILQFVALALVWAAADRLSRRRGLGLARGGAIIALVYALLTVLPTMPDLYKAMEELGKPGPRRLSPGPPAVWVSLVFTYITAFCGLVGSILALRQLSRPEVERVFKR